MSIKENWLSVFSKEDIKEFVENKMYATVNFIAPVIDENYGAIYLCQTNENMKEYTRDDSYVLEFGNFGLVSKNFNNDYVDDITLALTKPYIFKEYILWVAEKNVNKTIDGKTYKDCFIDSYIPKAYRYKRNGFKSSSAEDQVYIELINLFDQIIEGIDEIEKRNSEKEMQ